jgi:hypothetical protein
VFFINTLLSKLRNNSYYNWVNRNFIVQLHFFNLFPCNSSSYSAISDLFFSHIP